jgi:multiple sugar transport system substrate-binding protein
MIVDANSSYGTGKIVNQTRVKLLTLLSNQIPIDLISVDQPWLGDFAERGFLSNITDRVEKWGRLSDWYQSNTDGMVYKKAIYGIWAWTDVRGIWYWKDLLNESGISPDTLETWQGYIEAVKKLNFALKDKGIEGGILFNVTHSPDLWYPYLWMLGGDIIKTKEGHPTKGSYWFPAYNSTEGLEAMEFIKRQADAGIKPEDGDLDGDFVNKKFATIISGSWLSGRFPAAEISDLKQKVGFIPMFPVPDNNIQTSTMMGGWLLSIPKISKNKDLASELITIMLEPKVLAPWLAAYKFLPTQKVIGEGNYSNIFDQALPYANEILSMIQFGRGRPNIPEYPQIAEHLRQAIYEVQFGIKEPKQALDDAAAKSAKVLGW